MHCRSHEVRRLAEDLEQRVDFLAAGVAKTVIQREPYPMLNGRSAVIVVDIQNDFIPQDTGINPNRVVFDGEKFKNEPIDPTGVRRVSAFASAEADEATMTSAIRARDRIINRITSLIKRRQHDLLIFSMDDHTDKHCSFTPQEGPYPAHCVHGTWGQYIVPELRYNKTVIKKINDGTCRYVLKGDLQDKEGYSAFFKGKGPTGWENSPVEGTIEFGQLSNGLHELLKEKGIDTLYVCGVAQNICVCDTVRDARNLGYNTILVNDASLALDIEVLPNILKGKDTCVKVKALGVQVCDAINVMIDDVAAVGLLHRESQAVIESFHAWNNF
jgi:nicotinamidase/pyrazinamidase